MLTDPTNFESFSAILAEIGINGSLHSSVRSFDWKIHRKSRRIFDKVCAYHMLTLFGLTLLVSII